MKRIFATVTICLLFLLVGSLPAYATTYDLTIKLDESAVNEINGVNQVIAVTKSKPSMQAPHAVVWLSIPPGENVKVSWDDKYQVYSSYSDIQNGALISTTDTVNATDKNQYTYDGTLHSEGNPILGSNEYGVIYESTGMKDPKPMTFGMQQAANVNTAPSGGPLSASGTLPGESATFMPKEEVYVFLLGSEKSGTVIDEVTGTPLKVDLTFDTSATIHYDKNSASFKQGAG